MASPADSEAPPPSRLLALPAELKNEIYRLVLVRPEGERVTITDAGYDRGGGLLGACKEIRSETVKIFYLENSFEHEIRRFDSMPMRKFWSRLSKCGMDLHQIKIKGGMADEPCWRNLLDWLRAIHDGTVGNRVYSPEKVRSKGLRDLRSHIMSALFHAVKVLEKQPWEVVEELLVGMRPSLITADERWAED